jgi:hypothetical protein
MKKFITILAVVLLSSIVIAQTTRSVVEIFIKEDVMEPYRESVEKANVEYKRCVTPILTKAQRIRMLKIERASNTAITTLTRAGAKASPLEKKKLTIQVAVLEKLRDDDIGDAPKITPKVSVLSACGRKFKGHTYLVIVSKVNWKEAKDICKKIGGHLVYIETAEEMQFITKLYKPFSLWIGALYAHKEGDWRWLNGKIVNRDFWDAGEPGGKTAQNQALYRGGTLFDAVTDNDVHGFICEWEQ